MVEKLFSNTRKLTKFILKRELIYVLVWLVLLSGLTFAVAVTFNDMYSTPEELLGMAQALDNPALIAMVGPTFGDTYTIRHSLFAKHDTVYSYCNRYNEYLFSHS